MAGLDFETVVIDNGSRFSKLGINCAEDVIENVSPRFVVPTDLLSDMCPVERGIITNWDDMEKLWHHCFYEKLSVAPEEHPILLTQVSQNPKDNKEKTEQIMFETFNVPALYIAEQPVLSLFAAGRQTGTVLESGDGVTYTVPIQDGKSLPYAVSRAEIAGRDLTLNMFKLLKRNVWLGKNIFENCNEAKENFAYVALDFEEELQWKGNNPNLEKEHVLPDGEVILLGEERFRCPELLFKPYVLGDLSKVGIHETLYTSMTRCDNVFLRRELFSNIILGGGSTLFKGLGVRLEKEIKTLSKTSLINRQCRVETVCPPNREYSAYIGGTILSSLTTFEQMLTSKEDYDEGGGFIPPRRWQGF